MIFLHEHLGLYLSSSFPGWVLKGLILVIECMVISRILTQGWLTMSVIKVVVVSNVVSSLCGGFISPDIFWFLWVTEEDIVPGFEENAARMLSLSLMITIAIEVLVNVGLLRKKYSGGKILLTTAIVNLLTCLSGAVSVYFFWKEILRLFDFW